jgi:hypothetical protein
MPAPPALLDECMDVALVPALRARGFDVVSIQEVGPCGVDDVLVLERAVQLGRVLSRTTRATSGPRTPPSCVEAGATEASSACRSAGR